jgi:transcriptional regulator with GAF, ATPase, and Fis domain
MASSTNAPDFRTRYYLRVDITSAEVESDFDPLLNTLAAQSRSDALTIYRFNPEANEFNAAAVGASAQPLIRNAGVTLTASASAWLSGLTEPAQGNATTDERFERFPERLQFGVEAILAVPLRGNERLLGLLTLSRREAGHFDAEVVQLAKRTARLIAAVIERDDLQQVLRERKVVERAKGILQQRRGLSEERAYVLLRNTSRRSRNGGFNGRPYPWMAESGRVLGGTRIHVRRHQPIPERAGSGFIQLGSVALQDPCHPGTP